MIRDGKKTFTEYFRKKPEPKELVRKWQADIRSEQRQIEKSIRQAYLCLLSCTLRLLALREV